MYEASCMRAGEAESLGEEREASESSRIDAGERPARRAVGWAVLDRAKEDAADLHEACRIEAMMAGCDDRGPQF